MSGEVRVHPRYSSAADDVGARSESTTGGLLDSIYENKMMVLVVILIVIIIGLTVYIVVKPVKPASTAAPKPQQPKAPDAGPTTSAQTTAAAKTTTSTPAALTPAPASTASPAAPLTAARASKTDYLNLLETSRKPVGPMSRTEDEIMSLMEDDVPATPVVDANVEHRAEHVPTS